MNTKYRSALQDFKIAAGSFQLAREAYRNRLLTDSQFLAAKAEFEQAQKVMDMAETEEIKKVRESA